jgi:hypothetical protein
VSKKPVAVPEASYRRALPCFSVLLPAALPLFGSGLIALAWFFMEIEGEGFIIAFV